MNELLNHVLPYLIPALGLIAMWGAYHARTLTLAGTRRAVPAWRQWSFTAGLLLIASSLSPPVDNRSHRSLYWHMLQHITLADVAAFFLVLGTTRALLAPILRLTRAVPLHRLMRPAPAYCIWIVLLVAWHVPAMYNLAVHHDTIHALEHICFITAGCLFWAVIQEPIPGPERFGTAHKVGFIFGARLFDVLAANILMWSTHPFYGAYTGYGTWSALHDQNLAGIAMMTEGSIVLVATLLYLVVRWANESERYQELVEAGADPRRARRAVRYHRPIAEPLTAQAPAPESGVLAPA